MARAKHGQAVRVPEQYEGLNFLRRQHWSISVVHKLLRNMQMQFKLDLLKLRVNIFHLLRFVLEQFLNCELCRQSRKVMSIQFTLSSYCIWLIRYILLDPSRKPSHCLLFLSVHLRTATGNLCDSPLLSETITAGQGNSPAPHCQNRACY